MRGFCTGRVRWWGWEFLVIAILAGILGVVTFWVRPLNLVDIGWEDLRGKEVLWVDARIEEEVLMGGRVKGAVRLEAGNYERGFGRIVEVWDGKCVLVVFCGSEGCGTSRIVAERLRKDLGFEGVFALKGGFGGMPKEMIVEGKEGER